MAGGGAGPTSWQGPPSAPRPPGTPAAGLTWSYLGQQGLWAGAHLGALVMVEGAAMGSGITP